ncbi:peptide ligase PGM1-related protein [Burkholderia sp. LMG 21824]|uniref:preATP grasp domain-containing protein n=1 Tax=Burkholderia sp. LMG 21824 TaxID=3158172 RepID=UPI003C2EA028
MPKLIVGNVDNEHMLGDWSWVSGSPKFRQMSSIVANRMAWLVDAGDVLLLPAACSTEFLNYICEIKDVDPKSITVIAASDDSKDPKLLTFQTLSDPILIERVRKAMDPTLEWRIRPYFFDRTISWLIDHLPISDDEAYTRFMKQGGAEILNSKAEFRRMAAGLGISIPNGQACSSVEHMSSVVWDLLDDTGIVMLKQDFNSGGDGNTVLTNRGDLKFAAGAGHIFHVETVKAVREVVSDIWNRQARGRNINLIAETFHKSTHIYFSDYYIENTRSAPRYLVHGEMRMEPLWVGFRIPGPIPAGRASHLMSDSGILTQAVKGLGYLGAINYDAVFLESGRPTFLEFNGRCGGTTHIDELATKVLGQDYMDKFHLITRNKVKCGPFEVVLNVLRQSNLLYSQNKKEGLFVMTDDADRTGTIEFLIATASASRADELEKECLSVLKSTMVGCV